MQASPQPVFYTLVPSKFLKDTNNCNSSATALGKQWKATDSRVTAVVWGNSAKARKLVATLIEEFGVFLHNLQ